MLDQSEQIAFFERLKDALPADCNMVAEVAAILETSTDSVYRRVRGETALSYGELLTIHRRLNLKQTILFPLHNIEEVNFEYARPAYGQDTLFFLKQIEQQMLLANRRNNMSISLASDDLPFFMHFLCPGLLQFKLLVFSGRDLQNADGPREDDNELEQVCNNILKRWLEADAMEIWGNNPFDSTLKQIRFYLENNMINEDYASYLLHQLYEMCGLIDKWTASGKKSHGNLEGGDILLYHSEMNMGEMTLILAYGEEMTTYKSNYSYSYLRTEHPKFCEETKVWLNDLAAKGMLISGSAQKYRKRYISLLKESVRDAALSMNIRLNRPEMAKSELL